jgi:predicted lipoprotein with Yx(FWY)xxD motif
MRHPKIIIAGIGLAAVATVGGVTAASAGASPASSAPSTVQSAATTVRTASVTGGLAQLWPPLTSAAPAAGLSGRLAVLNEINGRQVTYNGHALYTFADDRAGLVTGQGVQNFFVATPGLAPIGSSGSAGSASAVPSGGFGY